MSTRLRFIRTRAYMHTRTGVDDTDEVLRGCTLRDEHPIYIIYLSVVTFIFFPRFKYLLKEKCFFFFLLLYRIPFYKYKYSPWSCHRIYILYTVVSLNNQIFKRLRFDIIFFKNPNSESREKNLTFTKK